MRIFLMIFALVNGLLCGSHWGDYIHHCSSGLPALEKCDRDYNADIGWSCKKEPRLRCEKFDGEYWCCPPRGDEL